MTDRINLLHVVLEMHSGGLQRLITDTTLATDRNMFNVEICCLNELGIFAEELESKGITVTLLPKSDTHLLLYPIRLAKLMRKKNIHIAHMHPGSFLFGALAGALARVPAIVYTEHGRSEIENKQRVIEDRISTFVSDRIISVSTDLAKSLVEEVKLPARKIRTVINGIRTKEFTPRPKSSKVLNELGIPADYKIVGTVARLADIKDQMTLLRAYRVVSEKIPNSHLILLGDGPMRESLQEYVNSNRLANHVTITGERNDVPEVLTVFDLFVLSSLREGTSISLLEAMASGVAPVVTNVGGNPAIVNHLTDGVVVEPRDSEGLAAAIIELLTNDARRKQYAENAARKVRERFSIDRMLHDYVEIYFEILQSKRKSRGLVRRILADQNK